MKNIAEIIHYVIQNILGIDPNPPAHFPAIGQTPIRESDKQRLAFRTEADTDGWRQDYRVCNQKMRPPAG